MKQSADIIVGLIKNFGFIKRPQTLFISTFLRFVTFLFLSLNAYYIYAHLTSQNFPELSNIHLSHFLYAPSTVFWVSSYLTAHQRKIGYLVPWARFFIDMCAIRTWMRPYMYAAWLVTPFGLWNNIRICKYRIFICTSGFYRHLRYYSQDGLRRTMGNFYRKIKLLSVCNNQRRRTAARIA